MKKSRLINLIISAVLTVFAYVPNFVSAEIKMPKIFSDGMILQRGIPVKIWGKSNPNSEIEVQFGSQKKAAKASQDGDWSLSLEPLKASNNAEVLTVFENGKEDKKFSDVLVGEVWILGGQSNMAWKTKHSKGFEDVKTRAKYPSFRYFFIPVDSPASTKQFDCPKNSRWEAINPENVGETSGVGFFFGENLFKDLGGDIPVGLIDTAFGGTTMAAWMPEEAFKGVPFLEKNFKAYTDAKAKYVYEDELKLWEKRTGEWRKKVAEAKAAKKKSPSRPSSIMFKPIEISPWNSKRSPALLFNGKIAPIAGFTSRGAIWYQGESDSSGEALKDFKPQFIRLIDTWRKYWGQGDNFYFAWVQLASLDGRPDWPETRWQQYLTLKDVKNGGMTSIVDCGEKKDIHPKDKYTVGKRLELLALHDVYGKKNIRSYGPVFKNAVYTPNSVEIVFDLKGGKLVSKGDTRGFQLKIGGEWKNAHAEIEGKMLVVKPLDKIDANRIEGVRYLWESWALPNVWLFNSDGLPAMPFIDLRK